MKKMLCKFICALVSVAILTCNCVFCAEYMGDELKTINQQTGVRSFELENVIDEFISNQNLGITGIGTLTVQGVQDGENYSTINLNGKSGFVVNSSSSNLILKDIKIVGGISQTGGVVNLTKGTLTIDNVIFENNIATNNGGAIYNDGGTIGNITAQFIRNGVYNSGNSFSGAIRNQNNGKIGIITGNFINNYVQSTGKLNVYGGAVNNKQSTIEKIVGNFIGNYVVTSNEANGGAINNSLNGKINGIVGNFEENYAKSTGAKAAFGGAIKHENGTIGDIEGSFLGNYVEGNSSSHGGAIWAAEDITLKADGKDTQIKDNYVQIKNGTKSAEAIWVNNNEKTLTLKSTNNGSISMYDYTDGIEGYKTKLTGDETGTINLYNDIKNSDVTVDVGNLNLTNGIIKEYAIRNLNSDASTKWSIDIDTTNNLSDSLNITLGDTTTGIVAIDSLNITGDLNDFEVTVLKGNSSALTLALSDNILNDSRFSNKEYVLIKHIRENHTMTSPINTWDTVFEIDNYDIYGKGLIEVVNNSNIKFSVSETEKRSTGKDTTPIGETLATINQKTGEVFENRSFVTEDATKTYISTVDVGTTGDGTMTVQGAKDEDGNISTINLNGNQGFIVGAGKTLNIENVKIIGGVNDIAGSVINNQGTVNNIIGVFEKNHVSCNYATQNGVYGGVIVNNNATITNINGDFKNNYVQSITGEAQGGAIYNKSGVIKNIVGNFEGNYAITENGKAQGGAFNQRGGSTGSITGDFINNYVQGNGQYIQGGAIYVNGSTVGEISGSFIGNYAIGGTNSTVQGGAILYTNASANNSVTLVADNKNNVIKDNYIQKGEGEKLAEAIYIDKKQTTLNLKAINNGAISMYDYINGEEGYKTKLTGDKTGTINLYNDIKNSDVTVDVGNVNLANGIIKEYAIRNLKSDASTKWSIDIDTTNNLSDSINITAGNATTGTVTINSLNITGDLNDFEVTVLKGNSSALTLAISENLINDDTYKTILNHNEIIGEISSVANWNTIFEKTVWDTVAGKEFSIIDNSKIKMTTKIYNTEQEIKSQGDTLSILNQKSGDGFETRSFITNDPTKIYTATSPIGTTGTGSMTVQGAKDNEGNISTIDLKENNGFTINKANTTLNLKDVKIIGADKISEGGVISHSNGILNIDNVVFEGNSTTNGGGAIYNVNPQSTNGTIKGNFNNNYVTAANAYTYGGAIHNSDGAIIRDIIGDFRGNYVISTNTNHAFGGAIGNANSYNYNSNSIIIDNIIGNFTENYVEANNPVYGAIGGAIFNQKNISIGNIEGNFERNYAKSTNSSARAGAIYLHENGTINNIKGNFIQNYTKSENNYADGGAILNVKNSVIKNIEGNFTQNYSNGSSYSYGGAISNKDTTAKIINIKSNFTQNYANGSSYAFGGAIYNIGEISNIAGDFEGNYAQGNIYGQGGAIRNTGTIGSIESSFTNNFAKSEEVGESEKVHGGAIYTNKNIILVANNKNTVIKDNYIQIGDGDKQYEAIYVNGNDKTLTLSATNEHSISLYDYTNGTEGYKTVLTGDKTGTINLYNDIKNSDVTVDVGNVNLVNGIIKEYAIRNLNSDASSKWSIDVDTTNNISDCINVVVGAESLTAGTVTIDSINIIGNLLDFEVTVLKGNSSALALALSDSILNDTTYNNTILYEHRQSSDNLTATATWTQKFNTYDWDVFEKRNISIQNNSKIRLLTTYFDGEKTTTTNGDTMVLLNQSTQFGESERTFSTNNPNEAYTLTENLGTTASGTFNVIGAKDEAGNTSIINMANKTGFKLSNENTSLNIQNIEFIRIKQEEGSLINITDTTSSANLTNIIASEAGINIIKNSGTLTISGDSNINAGILNNGTLNLNGIINNSTITGTGSSVLSGNIINNSPITQAALVNLGNLINESAIIGAIANTGSIETSASNILSTIMNYNSLILTGGEITQNITGTGTTKITGDVVNYANISNSVNVTQASSLTTSADNISNTISNSGRVDLTGGTITHDITETGSITFSGDVITNIKLATMGAIIVKEGASIKLNNGLSHFADKSSNIIFANSSTLNLMNGEKSDYQFDNITIAQDNSLNLGIDWGDRFNSNSTNINGNIILSAIDLTATNGSKSLYTFTNLGEKVNLSRDVKLNVTKTSNNYVEYNQETGELFSYNNQLKRAVETTEKNETNVYVMKENESAGGKHLAGTLIVQGEGQSIVKDGVIVGDGKNSGADLILRDVNIEKVSTLGNETGAITINGGNNLSIFAQNNDVSISGIDGDNTNAIYLNDNANGKATANLDAGEKTITINNDIRSNSQNNRVTFSGGKIIFNGVFDPAQAVVDGATVVKNGVDEDIQWILTNGTLHYLNDSYLNNALKPNSINFNGGILDTRNGVATTFNLQNLTISADSNFYADVDLANKKMDNFGNSPVTYTAGTLHISGLNIISDAVETVTNVKFTEDAALMAHVDYTGSPVMNALSPIYKYNVSYDDTTGDFTFSRFSSAKGSDAFNPAILAAPVAAQIGGYLTQLNSYDEAFKNMDMYMLMPKKQRQAMKFKNKITSKDNRNIMYDPTIAQYENKAGWFRPYVTFENVPLKNGPKVSNTAYGSFFGVDSELIELGHGWDGMGSLYIGYNGSHQTYDGTGIYQNGGTIGLTGVAYKGNFFTGLTMNVSANSGEANTIYGKEDFAMLMTGISSKSGYNIELADGKFIIQPNFQMSYTLVNMFDYHNAAGVKISSDPLHAVTLEPGIKLIGNLKNGWQPYAGASIVWNVMDKTKFKANDVALPDMSVKPYVKYGVGIRKSWGERLTGFFQVYMTNGGRNGVGLQAGLRWSIGK